MDWTIHNALESASLPPLSLPAGSGQPAQNPLLTPIQVSCGSALETSQSGLCLQLLRLMKDFSGQDKHSMAR
jgi:hypothetical protein